LANFLLRCRSLASVALFAAHQALPMMGRFISAFGTSGKGARVSTSTVSASTLRTSRMSRRFPLTSEPGVCAPE
jgi:hypothetical protein